MPTCPKCGKEGSNYVQRRKVKTGVIYYQYFKHTSTIARNTQRTSNCYIRRLTDAEYESITDKPQSKLRQGHSNVVFPN